VRLYCNVFKVEQTALSKELLRRIKRLDGLTPGDVYTVFSRMAFLGIDSVDHQEVVDALEAELQYKHSSGQAKIGFVS